MPRDLRASAVLAAITLTASACMIPGVTGGCGPEDTPTAESTSRTEAGPGVTPRYPALLGHGTRPTKYESLAGEGGVDFRHGAGFEGKKVRFRLSYQVAAGVPGEEPELLQSIRRDLRRHRGRSEPYAVKAGRGLVGQVHTRELLGARNERAYGPDWGVGTYRFYAIAGPSGGPLSTRQAAVALVVFAPDGHALTSAHRATAERLMKSVVFGKSWVVERPGGSQITPVVPVNYVRPPGLAGGDRINVDGHMSGQLVYDCADEGIRVRLVPQRSESGAAALYRTKRRVGGLIGQAQDIREIRDVRIPGWIEEGHREQRPFKDSHRELYVFRAGKWSIELEAERPEDARSLRALVTSLKPA